VLRVERPAGELLIRNCPGWFQQSTNSFTTLLPPTNSKPTTCIHRKQKPTTDLNLRRLSFLGSDGDLHVAVAVACCAAAAAAAEMCPVAPFAGMYLESTHDRAQKERECRGFAPERAERDCGSE